MDGGAIHSKPSYLHCGHCGSSIGLKFLVHGQFLDFGSRSGGRFHRLFDLSQFRKALQPILLLQITCDGAEPRPTTPSAPHHRVRLQTNTAGPASQPLDDPRPAIQRGLSLIPPPPRPSQKNKLAPGSQQRTIRSCCWLPASRRRLSYDGEATEDLRLS